MHLAHHTAGLRCIHEQSQCKRQRQIMGIPWARSAIWREWKHRHRERQRLRKEGNAWINKVSDMRLALAKTIAKVCISWYFESPETDLHIAENACGIDYANTWSPKQALWLAKSQSLHCSTSDNGWETLWTSLPELLKHAISNNPSLRP
jgi:hypothetical protein